MEDFNSNSHVAIRDFNWIKKLPKYFDEFPRPLFAVGAIHLFGEYGLLSLLEKSGFAIGEPLHMHQNSN